MQALLRSITITTVIDTMMIITISLVALVPAAVRLAAASRAGGIPRGDFISELLQLLITEKSQSPIRPLQKIRSK